MNDARKAVPVLRVSQSYLSGFPDAVSNKQWLKYSLHIAGSYYSKINASKINLAKQPKYALLSERAQQNALILFFFILSVVPYADHVLYKVRN